MTELHAARDERGEILRLTFDRPRMAEAATAAEGDALTQGRGGATALIDPGCGGGLGYMDLSGRAVLDEREWALGPLEVLSVDLGTTAIVGMSFAARARCRLRTTWSRRWAPRCRRS